MLLTLTTTHRPATDLGHLLHKHPDRLQRFTLGFGEAQVFYFPEASEERCTAALPLRLDPVSLVRGRPGAGGEGPLASYVNDGLTPPRRSSASPSGACSAPPSAAGRRGPSWRRRASSSTAWSATIGWTAARWWSRTPG